MKNDKPTYTLWNGSSMIATYPHTRDGMDAAMERAYGLRTSGIIAIYSSRGMTDVEADADTLASAGYGTDEDYGYYGDDSCYDY